MIFFMTDRGDIQLAGNRYYTSSGMVRPTVSTIYKPLADGTAGTKQTLAAMAQAVKIGLPPEYVSYRDGSMIRAACNIADCLNTIASSGQIAALYSFCRDQIRYVDHPWNMQVVQDAKRTMQLGEGDCVSKSVCLSTLLSSLGYLSRFVAQASTPDGFDHVYVEASPDDGASWLALDPTADGKDGRPQGDVGWTQKLEDGGFEMTYPIF